MLRKMILLAAFTATPALAEEFPVRVPDGATWTITGEHSRKVEGDRPQQWSLTTTKRLTWRAGRGGRPATLTVTPVSATPAPGSPPELARARSLSIPATLAVDENLAPQSIVNRDEVRAAFVSLVPKAANAPGEMIDASTMAMIASEIGTAARLQGLSLKLGETIKADGELPSPLSGAAIRTEETARLESYDPASHRAVVVWRETPDPASYRESLAATLQAMARDKVDPAKIEAARAAFAGMSMTGENTCRGEIDTATGLATNVECTLVQTVTDGDKIQRNTEHWTITQTSPEKS
jgi:hypothetical protein